MLIQGSGTSEGFESLLDRINKSYEFTTVRQKSGFGPSDHSSFASKKFLFYSFGQMSTTITTVQRTLLIESITMVWKRSFALLRK
jgi:hypothetical protein